MKNLASVISPFSIEWATNIISSPLFRTVLVIIWIIAFVRLLLGRVTFTWFIKITISLLLITLIPQLLTFFHHLFI